MRKAATESQQQVDFTNGIRGKHSAALKSGHTVKIRHEDGSVTVQKFIPDADAIVLDQDVRKYFPDADSVNNALRGLIAILPKHPRADAQAIRRTRAA